MTPLFRNPRLGVPLLLALLVLAVFGQTVRHDFISFDDVQYVVENPVVSRGLTVDGVLRAFSEPMVGNYHPLTILSHMADVSVFGLSPVGHHAVNVLLHLTSTLVLFLLVRSLVASPSVAALVAALFAVHPLHVEPVAWVASRKDLLSTLFWFLSMRAWVGYARGGGAGRYISSLLLAAGAMLSKPMAVTLPLTLLMLDLWPLSRIGPRSDDQNPGDASQRTVTRGWAVVEKVPFLLLSVAVSVATVVAQTQGGAGIEGLPFLQRAANAAVAYATYLWRTVWPTDLAVFYPHPYLWGMGGLPIWKVVLSFFILVVISVAVWQKRASRPHLLFGWVFFVVTVTPTVGFIQVGGQGIADRYMYLPLAGPFIALAVEVREQLVDLGVAWRIRATAIAWVVVMVFSVVAFRQTMFWRDGESLYVHAIEVTGRNPMMLRVLGENRLRLGRLDDAKIALREAVRLRPADSASLNWLAVALIECGELDEGERTLRVVVQVAPDYAPAWINLGNLLTRRGRFVEAIEAYRLSVRFSPSYLTGWYTLGMAKASMGDYGGAVEALSKAIELAPGFEAAWYNLGVVRLATGDLTGAVEAEGRLMAMGSRFADRLALEISMRTESEATGTYPQTLSEAKE